MIRFSREGDLSWFAGVLELPVTASHADLIPTILSQDLDDFPDLHSPIDTGYHIFDIWFDILTEYKSPSLIWYKRRWGPSATSAPQRGACYSRAHTPKIMSA